MYSASKHQLRAKITALSFLNVSLVRRGPQVKKHQLLEWYKEHACRAICAEYLHRTFQ
jgi:hypothetical protein